MMKMITTAQLKATLANLHKEKCSVEYDLSGGTATAMDKDVVVLRAIQKGVGGDWITTFFNSNRICWKEEE